MTPESIPSGALKVAELLNEARVEGDLRYTLRTPTAAFVKGAEFALNIAQRDLASPSPATGAMADALAAGDGTLHGAIDYWQQRALAAEAKATGALSEPSERQLLALACRDVDAADTMLPVQRASQVRVGRERWESFLREGATLSSAKREAEPLTMKQKSDLFDQACAVTYTVWDDFIAGLEAAEAHHGITAASQVEPEDKQ